MPVPNYARDRTALLSVDPYNDFLSESGKLWPRVKDIAGEVGLLDNLRTVTAASRSAGIQVFIVPHRRWEPGDFENWDHPSPYQLGSGKMQAFAKEHWGGSGFANTDLDLLLKQKRITHVIVIGLLANTCVETNSRFAAELRYHVTLVKDATAEFGRGNDYAHQILTPSS